jgi:hypothetical protein
MQLNEVDFSNAIKPAYQLLSWRVEELMQEAKNWGRSPDYPWNSIVMSFVTNGGVKHYANLKDKELLTWSSLSSRDVDQEERRRRFSKANNPIRGKSLHGKLESCYQRIDCWGGVDKFRKKLSSQANFEEKFKLLKSFEGIGDKYARNILMDGYDNCAQNRIALDSRIRSILIYADLSDKKYGTAESFLVEVANQLKISCWYLDRFLFSFDQLVKLLLGRAQKLKAIDAR